MLFFLVAKIFLVMGVTRAGTFPNTAIIAVPVGAPYSSEAACEAALKIVAGVDFNQTVAVSYDCVAATGAVPHH